MGRRFSGDRPREGGPLRRRAVVPGRRSAPARLAPTPPGTDELDRLAAAAATGRLCFDLAVAAPMGRMRPVAELRIGERLPLDTDGPAFRPEHCGGGIEPPGMINRMRDFAYPMVQRVRAERPTTSQRS